MPVSRRERSKCLQRRQLLRLPRSSPAINSGMRPSPLVVPFWHRSPTASEVASSPKLNEIATRVRGRPIRLVANGAGRADGAERFAIHGLILDRAVEKLEPWLNERGSGVRGLIACGSFGDRWLSELQLEIGWLLESSGLELYVTARNVGSELAPV